MIRNYLEEAIEKITKGRGINELSKDEKEVYFKHLKLMEQKPVEIEDWKNFISSLKGVLSAQVADATEGSDESRNLKARLKNVIVFENFLYGPERAKAALQKHYKAVAEKEL